VIRLGPAEPGGPITGPLTIVGVVPNVRTASPRDMTGLEEFEPVVYVPLSAEPDPFAQIVVRSDAGAAAVTAFLREAVRAVDPDLPVSPAVNFGEAVRQELSILMLFSSMFGVFAAVALGLAAIGLYAVVAVAVAWRTRELGIRIALGARPFHVWWLVTRQAALQLAVGVALGLAGAYGAGRLLAGALLGIETGEPILIVALPLLLAVVALAACAGPAARATRVDPAVTLRAE
jgi:ABC-type antimicrobial peptide transport system permease subunit